MAAKKPADTKKAPASKTADAKPSAKGDLRAEFEAAGKRAMSLKERPDNDTLLRLYALYKQGAEGDVKGARPGMFDFVGGAKYDAWAKLKGTSADEAMKKYVDLVKKLGG
jgi:acyl-CoA-binding protein